MKNFSKKQIIGVVAVAAVLGFIIFLLVKCSKPEIPATNNEENLGSYEVLDVNLTTATSTESNTKTPAASKTTAPSKTVAPDDTQAASQSYLEALKIYGASGYRFQFVDCRASPGQLTMKVGKTFMLDNRDAKAHKIKVGSVTYNVAAYGYAIATAKTLGLNYILCDGAGSARIQVEP